VLQARLEGGRIVREVGYCGNHRGTDSRETSAAPSPMMMVTISNFRIQLGNGFDQDQR
jgi:hypothetical protein